MISDMIVALVAGVPRPFESAIVFFKALSSMIVSICSIALSSVACVSLFGGVVTFFAILNSSTFTLSFSESAGI